MLPWVAEFSGRLDHVVVRSEVLRGNPLGDPCDRPLLVYLPPEYEAEPERRFPSIYVLIGYGGHVTRWLNRPAFGSTLPELVDGLFARKQAPPTIVVFVDGWTKYGGSQYLDSPGTGRYHSYLCNEVVAFIDGSYRTLAAPAHRAVMGHSSGGFGAMVSAMLRPDLFGALASHAGDALFEINYLPELREIVRALRPYNGDIMLWWTDFTARLPNAFAGEEKLAEALAVSAAFSARPDGNVDLPMDTCGGQLRKEVWQRWLAWDPVRMAEHYSDALRTLRAVWLEAGTRDEHHLDLGAQAVYKAFLKAGVDPDVIHYELVQGATHSVCERRQPLSLAWLAERIAQ